MVSFLLTRSGAILDVLFGYLEEVIFRIVFVEESEILTDGFLPATILLIWDLTPCIRT